MDEFFFSVYGRSFFHSFLSRLPKNMNRSRLTVFQDTFKKIQC